MHERDLWNRDVCATPPPRVDVHCFVPEPHTTRGEGRELSRLAAENNWHTVIVVTALPHLARARFILGRCFHGDLVMVASPDALSLKRWAYEFAYQTAGYLRAILQPGC